MPALIMVEGESGLRKRLSAAIEPVLLVVLLTGGLLLRLQKLDWDHGNLAHPDERHVLMVADTVEWPASLEQFLDVRSSPLNPFSRPGAGRVRQPETFAYGHFPVYVLKGLSVLLEKAATPLRPLIGADAAADLARSTNLWQMVFVGRVLSALADAGTILVVYALGRRLFGQAAGLLAAALLSLTVLHIQLSHFFAVDTVLAFFVTLTLYWLVRVGQGGGRREAVFAGISLALAVASKSSAAALGLAWIVAFAMRSGSRSAAERARLAVISFLAGAITFLLVSPYVVLDLPMFLDSFQKEGGMVRGTYDFPYTRQYRGTTAYLYPILQQLRWGMGWLPGLLGFGGLAWTLIRLRSGSVKVGAIVVLAWVLPYFLLTGGFMVKFMRYGAPLTPALYVLGAGMLAALARRRRALACALGGLTVVYAVVWSLAFSSVYRNAFTRHEASEWIYRNLPAGSVITKEEWDDLIPYGMEVDGRGMSAESRFEVLAFPLQEPDDQAKVDMLVDRLLRADYIIVSSNRFYGWLPRLQDRFPVSNRYYELLFQGRLGFTLVKEFTSYPSLGSVTFADDGADESFTVYDHPKVMIFGRSSRLTEADLRSLFQPLVSETSREEDLLLPVAVDDFPTVDDFGWNRWARDGIAAVAWWWLVATAVGLAAWPLTQRLLGRLWAGGWALARVIGLLLVAYPVWLAANAGLSANTAPALGAMLGLLGMIGAALAWRRRRGWRAYLREHGRELAAAEGVALAAYLVWVGVRLLNPDLWHPWWGGERPMEMGFLWAVLKSAQFPPYDPFYAGGIINYYYYGLYLVSCLTKLSGIPPEVAFNLALALFFSLTAASAFTLGASLVKHHRFWAGVAAALAVAVLGNLEGGLLLIRRWAELGAGAPGGDLPLIGWLARMVAGLASVLGGGRAGPEYDFWAPSRVIPDTINEFPFFSFLYGDLHPHVLDMPVILAAAAVVLCLFRARDRAGWEQWARMGLLAVLIGAAVATNTWDAPVLVAMALGAVVLAWLRDEGHDTGRDLLLLAATGVVGVALAYPFLANYEPPPGGFALAEDGSPLLHWLRVWGLFALVSAGVAWEGLRQGRPRRAMVALVSLAARRWRRLPRVLDLTERTGAGRRLTATMGAAALAILVIFAALLAAGRAAGAVAFSLALLSLLAAAAVGERRIAFALGLVSLGWLVLLGTELFYLKDWLAGGSAYRMNTVFKFGIQAWLLLGAAAGALVMPRRQTNAEEGLLVGWRVPVLGLAVLAAVYPILGTSTRVGSRFPNASPAVGTLDSFAFMSVGAHFWPDENYPIVWAPEQEALQWLRDNVPGTPVVAEAALGYYREGGSRVAAYTGLPIPLGPQHEGEQRPKSPLGTRATLVRLLYESADPVETLELAERLGLTYIYVGQLERIAHGGDAVAAKFAQMAATGVLGKVFDNGVVAVYRLP